MTTYLDRGLTWRVTTEDGTLTINGVNLHTPAWQCPDLSALYGSPEQRGSDRLVPGTDGVLPNIRRATVTRLSLPFLVNGHWDQSGALYGDVESGRRANWAYLMTNVFMTAITATSTKGTVTATFTPPGGSAINAQVHVLPTPSPTLLPGGLYRTTIELSVPGGDLHI